MFNGKHNALVILYWLDLGRTFVTLANQACLRFYKTDFDLFLLFVCNNACAAWPETNN